MSPFAYVDQLYFVKKLIKVINELKHGNKKYFSSILFYNFNLSSTELKLKKNQKLHPA